MYNKSEGWCSLKLKPQLFPQADRMIIESRGPQFDFTEGHRLALNNVPISSIIPFLAPLCHLGFSILSRTFF